MSWATLRFDNSSYEYPIPERPLARDGSVQPLFLAHIYGAQESFGSRQQPFKLRVSGLKATDKARLCAGLDQHGIANYTLI